VAEVSEDRSNSVVEMSLTELAFIFFFILLTVSTWKISSAAEKLQTSEDKKQVLEQEVSQLSESLATASQVLSGSDSFDPQELFLELKAGRNAIEQLERALQEKADAEEQLRELTDQLPSEYSREELIRQLREYQGIAQSIKDYGLDDPDKPSIAVTELMEQLNDAKGQNINLRNKLVAVGNGLDHPPCWADPETGSIQYIFDVIINEDSVEFKAGWPNSRDGQALNNLNISQIPGVVFDNSELWARTDGLFQESVSNNCRHFVRIYDHSQSKKAFKNYMRGIENHFYKFLSALRYQ
jgi:biopolymer transport protein ExbB/TolQ